MQKLMSRKAISQQAFAHLCKKETIHEARPHLNSQHIDIWDNATLVFWSCKLNQDQLAANAQRKLSIK